MISPEPLIVALDFSTQERAEQFVDQIKPEDCRLKVGKELFTRAGPVFVERLVNKGFKVFLDLKFHDIPNTVAGAVCAAAELGVWMINVHASGGRRMMEEAAAVLMNRQQKPLLIGVTLLTSLSEEDLHDIGISESTDEYVSRLAKLACDCGLDGVVCSAREAQSLRKLLGEEAQLVTPGIRPSWASLSDQHRVMTPAEAIAAGANHLVVGRPVTQADDPIEALRRIKSEIEDSLQ